LRNELNHGPVSTWNDRPNAAGYIGKLTRVRGAKEMVLAMEYLDDSLHTHLELGGKFESVDLQTSLAQLPGWKHVNFRGYLDRIGVHQLLDQVRIGLVVLHPEPNYIHSQPTKMFEYMSAGIPVIASDFPLWRSFVEPLACGLLVDALRPAEIGKAIEYLLKNSDEAEEMGARGRKAIEEVLNWESETPKLLDLYSRLLM
jgi:glycosyltransferase involved in cell wall biosynthesis